MNYDTIPKQLLKINFLFKCIFKNGCGIVTECIYRLHLSIEQRHLTTFEIKVSKPSIVR